MDAGVAFWIFLAVIIIGGIIAGNWRNKHIESMKHETLRLIIEKDLKLDDKHLAELFKPNTSPSHEWDSMNKPGDTYRVLRVLGTIMMFVALGLGIATLWRGILFGISIKSDCRVDSDNSRM